MKPVSESRYAPWPVIFLAGPVIWYLYFWLVYLAAEAGCSNDIEGLQILGWPAVSFMTGVLTVGAVGLIIWYGGIGYRHFKGAGFMPGDDDSDDFRGSFIFLGVSLAILFLTATLFVGIPALVLAPC